jgi:hypothetical protein
MLVLLEGTGLNSSPVLNLGLIPTQHKKKNPVYKKKQGWEVGTHTQEV